MTKRTMTTGQMWMIFIGVLILVTLAWAFSPSFTKQIDSQSANAVSALFSGLAFAVLIFTMLLQKRELEYQRQELQLTREELRGQKEQLAAQNQTLRHQTRESTFFSLLNLLNAIINSIDLMERGEPPVPKHGRDCFTDFYFDYKRGFDAINHAQPNAEEIEKIREAYKRFADFRQSKVGHYHRILYRIIKFVDMSDIDAETKTLYAGLLRAQLSSYQLGLLFYNCLSEVGKGFKPWSLPTIAAKPAAAY